MLTNKKKKLILYLMEKNAPCTAIQLAKFLNISIRTVKIYVKDINSMTNQKIIFSSHQGYTIIKQNNLSFLEEQLSLPQNYSERAYYIIKKILIEHQTLNIFDLCDELFMSYSTLKSDLTKMNTLFQTFRIHFVTHNDIIQIKGSEKDKRSLLSHIILQETKNSVLDLKKLKQSFNNQDIEKITNIINDFFRKGAYNLNDFSYMNLLLHFSILIERVKKGHYLSEIREVITKSSQDSELLKALSSRIEKDFSLTLNAYEKNEIYILFKTNVNYFIDGNYDVIKKVIRSDYMNTVDKIINEVSELYSINLSHESFIIPFALHIQSLITRASLNKYNKNPLSEQIKKDWPIIYDIAIFISLKLSDIYQIEIAEDEVAFIFLRIGNEIDRQNTSKDKLKCVLLCSHYLNIKKKIYNQLLKDFSDDIIIDAIVSDYEELESYSFDLLITLIKDERNYHYSFILISPFRLDKQKRAIHEKIYEIQQSKKKELIFNNFDQYFHKDLFFTLENVSREETIQIVCDQMRTLGFVSSSFKEYVFEREKASSTSFGNIAIPHSVHMDAFQTKIGIVMSKKGIIWGNNNVNVVLVIAINKLDKQIFLTINESILSLFENQDILNIMKNTKNLLEFKDIVLHYL